VYIGLNNLGLNGLNSAFSPASLFTAGQQGAWYDPSDLNSMYQESAGTTPAVVGQPVGLLLDKRLGMTPGTEQRASITVGLVGVATPATYDTGTGAAMVVRVDVSNQSYIRLTGLSQNTLHRVIISGVAGGAVQVRVGNQVGTIIATIADGGSGTCFADTGANTQLTITAQSSGTSPAFTVTSIKQIPGNFAVQATSASRPVLQQVGSYYEHLLDGFDDSFSCATGGGGTTGFFYCGWIRVDGGAGTARTIWSDASGTNGIRARVDGLDRLSLQAANGAAFTLCNTVATLPVGETHLVTLWDDGTNLNSQIDLGAVATTARPVVTAGTAGFTEGKDNGAATSFFSGAIGTRVYCKGFAPDAATRTQVQRYVAAKAGITL
jgi:hypothetical protein